jgi:hypothetical protein
LNINICSSNDALGDGLFTPTPLIEFLSMPLGEQMLQMSDIMHKGKHQSQISKGLP